MGIFMETANILDTNIHNNEGLVSPIRRKTDPEIGTDAIMVMIHSDLEYLVKFNYKKDITRFNMGFFNLYRIINQEVCLSLSGPFLGAPQAVMGMEKLISLGAKRIWVSGWCGSISPHLVIGDLVIPERALSEEGTSEHYPVGKKAIRTDETLNRMLEQIIRKRGYNFLKGKVWTTDAPYRETREKVNKYKEQGILAVEMEMAALMTLSIYRNVKLAGLLTVSDELFNLKWSPGFSNPLLKRGSRAAGEIILKTVESLTS